MKSGEIVSYFGYCQLLVCVTLSFLALQTLALAQSRLASAGEPQRK
jgi:hypothetical protein